MSGRRSARSLMPASSTNSDSSGEYMSGCGRPASSSTSSMPVSAIVHWSAFSDEKLTLPPAEAHLLAELAAQLVLGGDRRPPSRPPWRENSAMIVRERSSSGPVMTTASPVAGSR